MFASIGVAMLEGPAERELRRLGRRCAAVLRLVAAGIAGVLALTTASAGTWLLVALAVWSVGYFLLMSRGAGIWLLAADAAAVCVVCLTQRWTVPPEVLHGSTSWVAAVVVIAVATWQWHSDVLAGGIATAATVLAYTTGAGMASASLLVGLSLSVQAVLSRSLYYLVRAGAREADRTMAGAEQARRAATVATARRADERAHLAAMHDTAAAIFQALGAGVVAGREPWLADQFARALDEVVGDEPHGRIDLLPLLDDVVRDSQVATELSAPDSISLPAAVAVAISRAVREALLNVARHAGVDAASVRVEHRAGRVLVEITDSGVGFDPAAVSPHRRGIALSLVERMATVGGRAGLTSNTGRGTRIWLEWPDG